MKHWLAATVLAMCSTITLAADFVPVFIYHRVIDTEPASDTVISTSLFDKHITALESAGFTFVTIKQVGEYMNGKRLLPQKTVAITFDDGWKDNTVSAAIMSKHKAAGTFFVLSGVYGGSTYLTKDELREIAKYPRHEIGVHTHTHLMEWWPNLDKIDDRMIVGEISLSKGIVEQVIGREVTSFAWPFGYNRPHLLPIIHSAGIHQVVNVDPAITSNKPKGTPLHINRINISGLCTPETLIQMASTGEYTLCK